MKASRWDGKNEGKINMKNVEKLEIKTLHSESIQKKK